MASPVTSPAVLPTERPQTVDATKPAKTVEPEKNQVPEGHVDMTGGLMSWITKTVAESKLLNDVAEKAKQGMEQVLTTLDPGMRGFLSDDGTVSLGNKKNHTYLRWNCTLSLQIHQLYVL